MNTSLNSRYVWARLAFALAGTLAPMLVCAGLARASSPPVKEILESHIGAKVNATNGTDICTVLSGDTCQPAELSSATGGFYYPEGVAATTNGDVYVADGINRRVQEFAADGTFIRMFGREVNETAHLKGEPANEDVCPVNVGDKCKAGVEGNAAGQLAELQSIAVDPASGDVYLGERVAEPTVSSSADGGRVQKFGPEGRFILEIGTEVNETTKGNVCTQEEIENEKVKCVAPSLHEFGKGKSDELFTGIEPYVTVGGPEDLLYAGDEGGVQEFETDGKYERSISLASSAVHKDPVGGIALDDSCSLHVPALTESTSPTCKEFDANYGDLYLDYQDLYDGQPATVYKFDQAGDEVTEFFPLTFEPRLTNSGQFNFVEVAVHGLAVGPSGTLAVAENEAIEAHDAGQTVSKSFVSLLNGTTGHLISESPGNESIEYGVAFDGNDELFAVTDGQEMLGYRPVPVGELVTKPESCVTEGEHETSVSVGCSLNGEVNPFGIAQTEVWFGWGTTCGLGSRTPVTALAPVSTAEGVSAPLHELMPNKKYCYQLAGEDEHVKTPEQLTGERVSFSTPTVPPRIVGEVSLATVGPFDAVMFGEVNPENSNTSYAFQYGQCENLDACPDRGETTAAESSEYGAIATVLEATELQPSSTYHYRLVAVNQAGEEAVNQTGGPQLPEGVFTTLPAPTVQAQTGSPSLVSTTSARIAGTVDPDGEASAYTFELGIYNGTNTRFGIVFSGSAGAGSTPVAESLALSGLQPGTTYAYRIAAHSGDGSTQNSSSTGATETFTTAGLPAVLALQGALAQLPIPAVAFPKEAPNTNPPKLTPAQKLAAALKACAKKPKNKRAACRRNARKKYATNKTKTKKK